MSRPSTRLTSDRSHLDWSVPALLFQVSRYPLLYGTLGAIRSLGRVGVPCHAVATARLSPHCYSRYLSGCHRPPREWTQTTESMLQVLRGIAHGFSKPAVLLPTDDESAVFTAVHADKLRPWFLLPEVSGFLPGVLASKHGLASLCAKHGVPSPHSGLATTRDEALRIAEGLGYPVVLKNSDPWSRLSSPVVPSTTMFGDARSLLELEADWPAEARVIVQEYLPKEHAEDWIVHVYCGTSTAQSLVFTGRKYRSWPPRGGVTTAATALRNEGLAALAAKFCAETGYKGIADMDWRFDRRDGQYKLVDFNPRLGANFRLFRTEAGVDVVRAQHLDLTGRHIAAGPPVYGMQFRVENLDWASRLAPATAGEPVPDGKLNGREYAWFARDDMRPFMVMIAKFAGLAATRMAVLAARYLKALPRRLGSAFRPANANPHHQDLKL